MNKNDLIQCHKRIKPHIHNTPVLKSKLINEMSNVTVDIKNREFLIACEDGKEEEVLELAKIFSERVSKLSERLNDLDHERLFLLAGILAEEDNKNLLKASGLDKAMNNIKKIAVVEKGWIGGGNTGRNTTIIRLSLIHI